MSRFGRIENFRNDFHVSKTRKPISSKCHVNVSYQRFNPGNFVFHAVKWSCNLYELRNLRDTEMKDCGEDEGYVYILPIQ